MALRAVAPTVRDWGDFRLSANQTAGLTVNSPIRFDMVTAGTLGLSAYTIALPAGRIFRLVASLSVSFSAGTGSAQTCWYDMTTGQYVGTSSQYIPPTNTGLRSQQPISHAIVDTTAGARSFQLRISATANLNGVFAGFSYAEVTELP